jgi:hypothetical protein
VAQLIALGRMHPMSKHYCGVHAGPNPSVNADVPPAWRVISLSRHAEARAAGYLHR